MRITLVALLLSGVAIADSRRVPAGEVEPIPLSVLYLSRQDDAERTSAFQEFLSERFHRCVVQPREDFTAEMIAGVDVVLFDWSQRERSSSQAESPLGRLEDWSTPTVFLGSAGLHMAEAWQVIGDAG
jgi:hypothetical protein